MLRSTAWLVLALVLVIEALIDNLFLDLRLFSTLISFNHSMNSSVYIVTVTDFLNHSVDQLVGLSVDQ